MKRLMDWFDKNIPAVWGVFMILIITIFLLAGVLSGIKILFDVMGVI
jgi:hypothetical protein